jgi:hypothetical protein
VFYSFWGSYSKKNFLSLVFLSSVKLSAGSRIHTHTHCKTDFILCNTWSWINNLSAILATLDAATATLQIIYSASSVDMQDVECSTFLQVRQQRSGDIITCTTRMLQFSSEIQQTWHTYYPRPQEQLLLKMFFYKLRP